MAQAEALGENDSFFDWQKRLIGKENIVFSGTLDRAWITEYAGDWQATLGRQRIAWGTNLIWNPVDLFNPSSPLDFENEEKPGTDALRIQYYLGPASGIEMAVAPAREADQTVAAVELVLNRWEYDWIALGGRRGSATVFGGAWAGHILGGGFRGEVLYTIPRNVLEDCSGIKENDIPFLLASIDGDYTFSNTLYLHGAILYNQEGTTRDAGGSVALNAYRRKLLTPGRLSLFAEIAKEIDPRVRVDLTGILNPYDCSFYTGPSVVWSVMTNFDLTAVGFLFGGGEGTEFGDNGEMILVKLKYSF